MKRYNSFDSNPHHRLTGKHRNTGNDQSGHRQPLQMSVTPAQKIRIKAVATLLMTRHSHMLLMAIEKFIYNPTIEDIFITEGLINPEFPNTFTVCEKDVIDALTPKNMDIIKYSKIIDKILSEQNINQLNYDSIVNVEDINKYIDVEMRSQCEY